MFHFVNVELSQLTPEDILRTKQVGLFPLLSLTDGGAEREQVKRMFREIRAFEDIDTKKKATLELLGYTLASLIFRKKSEDDQNWLIRSFYQMHDILRETPIYQEILREGQREGQLEYARSMLLAFANNRFPQFMQYANQCAESLSNISVLEDLTLKVGVAQTAEEALNYLLNWRDIYKDQL